VTLESRTLTLMAPTAEAKEMWVVGINAILSARALLLGGRLR